MNLVAGAVAAWRSQGKMVRAAGHDVFVLDERGGDGTPLLCLHGFPTCSRDWKRALPTLAQGRRVVVHDHLGFGLSAKPTRYSYSLVDQAEIALAVWRELGITRGHLIGHDYGTSVATELLARRERGFLPVELESVTLANGSVHVELAQLTPSQKLLRRPWLGPVFARLASQRLFKVQLRHTLADPKSVEDDELDLLFELMVADGGRALLPRIIGYYDERRRLRDRWVGALDRLNLPLHVLWGKKDPVAVPAIAEKLAAEVPGARLTWLPELGHYPMLEAPEQFARAVNAFIAIVEKVGAVRSG